MPRLMFVMRDDGDMTEPMNIMLLSALAKQRDPAWTSDLVVFEHDDILHAIKTKKPDVVAFSAITGSHQALLKANADIKKAAPGIKTVIGGPYATFSPQTVVEQPFDALGVGECDDAWPELLDAWASGSSVDNIPNIITKENASRVLRRTLLGDKSWKILPDHLRPRKVDLDDLPFMDRALIYENTGFKTRYKRTMMAGRGCPFRCTYCFEHAWNEMYKGKGKVQQRHSVSRLCDELKELKEHWDTRFIKFYDDVFPVFDQDLSWLEEFAETYPRKVGIPFHCLVRAELVDERKLRLLKTAGIGSITMSIEGGNAFVRDYVLQRDMSDEDMRKAFDLCYRLRIPTFANTILAVPAPVRPQIDDPNYDARLAEVLNVTRNINPKRKTAQKDLAAKIKEVRDEALIDDIQERLAIDKILRDAGVRETMIEYDVESILYNVDLKVSFGEFPVFYPYRGTELGSYAVEHGYFDGNYDKLHASYQTVSPLDCYSEKDKLTQQNLALLGTIVLEAAGSYNPVIQRLGKPLARIAVKLASLPITPLLLRLYSAAKNDMHARRMYPMPLSARERAEYLWENYVLDMFKQVGKKEGERPLRRNERPGQTLGGPPSV